MDDCLYLLCLKAEFSEEKIECELVEKIVKLKSYHLVKTLLEENRIDLENMYRKLDIWKSILTKIIIDSEEYINAYDCAIILSDKTRLGKSSLRNTMSIFICLVMRFDKVALFKHCLDKGEFNIRHLYNLCYNKGRRGICKYLLEEKSTEKIKGYSYGEILLTLSLRDNYLRDTPKFTQWLYENRKIFNINSIPQGRELIRTTLSTDQLQKHGENDLLIDYIRFGRLLAGETGWLSDPT